MLLGVVADYTIGQYFGYGWVNIALNVSLVIVAVGLIAKKRAAYLPFIGLASIALYNALNIVEIIYQSVRFSIETGTGMELAGSLAMNISLLHTALVLVFYTWAILALSKPAVQAHLH